MTTRENERRTWRAGAPIAAAFLVAASAAAQNTYCMHGPTGVAPPKDEKPAKLFVDPPLAEPLSVGEAVIHFRTDNLRVAPVFGAAALAVSPRVGHLHINVDDASWVWAHASREPVIVAGLAPGQHKVRVQLMNANHQRLDESVVTFTVREGKTTASCATQAGGRAPEAEVGSPPGQPRAKMIIDSPAREPLARGVVLFRYRTENLDVVPVFGPDAAAVSPRIGHIHVSVNETPWHWVDGSRNPIIVQGLAPGKHQIRIELASANHTVIDRQIVEVTIPGPNSKPAAVPHEDQRLTAK